MASKTHDDQLGFGFTLITIGIIWLLFKFNILTFSIFSAISDLWPLLLIVAGVNLIFRSSRFVSFIMWMLFIAVLLLYGQFGGGTVNNVIGMDIVSEVAVRDESWKTYQTASGNIDISEDVSLGTIDFDLGFGGVYIDSTSSSTLSYSVPEEITKVYSRESGNSINVDFNQDEKLFFNWGSENNLDYRFDIPEDVEWDLNLNIGALDSEIDLSNLLVRSLDIDCGAGDIEITYGEKVSQVYTKIDCGATEIALNIPEGVGIEVNLDGLIIDNNFSNSGLSKISDSIYRSDNFEREDIKIFVEIDTGVGEVTLRRY